MVEGRTDGDGGRAAPSPFVRFDPGDYLYEYGIVAQEGVDYDGRQPFLSFLFPAGRFQVGLLVVSNAPKPTFVNNA